MSYIGDYAEDFATLNFKFTTVDATGVPTVLAGTPVISVYKANGLTQSTAGITLTVDFDSVVGLNNVLIDVVAQNTIQSTKHLDFDDADGTTRNVFNADPLFLSGPVIRVGYGLW